MDKFLPQKKIKITSEDRPWFNQKLKKLDRKLKREYTKNKKSKKWMLLKTKFEEKCSEEKENYYKNIVEDLKTSKPSQWYSKLKRMSSHDQAHSEEPVVQSFIGISDELQAEKIAEQFSQISNLYDPLEAEDVCLGDVGNTKPFPSLEPYFIHKKIKAMKNNTAL